MVGVLKEMRSKVHKRRIIRTAYIGPLRHLGGAAALTTCGVVIMHYLASDDCSCC